MDNLRPWKRGQSGNPGGRLKRKWLTDAIEEMLQERLDEPKGRQEFKDAMWRWLLSGTQNDARSSKTPCGALGGTVQG